MTADEFELDRRKFLAKGGAAAALGLAGAWPRALLAQERGPGIDHTIRIGPVSLELAPGKIVKTTGYNGTVPGPVLRLREGKPVAINVINDAGYPDLVHWHGLYLPSVQDGAMEEGSPIIALGQSLLYSFTPKPPGTRWYHSHAMALLEPNVVASAGFRHGADETPEPDRGRPFGRLLMRANTLTHYRNHTVGARLCHLPMLSAIIFTEADAVSTGSEPSPRR